MPGHTRSLIPASTDDEPSCSDALPHLRDLTPEEVFLRVCDRHGVTADTDLLDAFRLLLDEDEAVAA